MGALVDCNQPATTALFEYSGSQACFWQPSYKDEPVYAADTEGQIVEMGFELAASEEKRLH